MKITPHQRFFLAWYERMAECAKKLPPDELAALEKWERENLDGHSIATSDWPGWAKYLPPPPWKRAP